MALADGAYVACVGELMWDLHCLPGASFAGELRLLGKCAGAAANVALLLTAAGTRTALLGQLANDAMGQGMRQQLARAGVDVSALLMVAGRCGLVFIEQQPGGMRCVSYAPQFERRVRVLPLPAKGHCRALHVAALAVDKNIQHAHASLATEVQRAGGWIVVDLNTRPRLWRQRALSAANRRLLAQAHVVKASRDDLTLLGLSSAAGALASARVSLGCPQATLVVTRGQRSSGANGPWGSLRRTVLPAVVHNTVGAGDAFCAGLLQVLCRDPKPGIVSRGQLLEAVDSGHYWARQHITRTR